MGLIVRERVHVNTEATKQYKVLVSTNGKIASYFSLTLVDSNHKTIETTWSKSWTEWYYGLGKEITFDINVEKDVGDIVQVKIKNDKASWFCRYVQMKSPSGKSFEFPCYRWIENKEVAIREGSENAQVPSRSPNQFPMGGSRPSHSGSTHQRKEDEPLRSQCSQLDCWYLDTEWIEGNERFSQDLHDKLDELPIDVQFDGDKSSHFFSNGINMKCVELPKTFPVTHEMLKGSLQRGLTLQQELEKGNIYIADYEILYGLEPNKKHQNSPHFLTAPICLLYNNKMDQIVPIAIQLSQKPGERSPIFLPNDNEHDWMLAKMWVKSSDFNVHQLVTHLLKTHLISEIFELAMYRQLSPVHPVYKLLIPHVRFTIAINTIARKQLISEDGVFSKISSISAAGIDELMKRAMKTITYKSMCFPEAIIARGMENTPKYYYRDDGMKIWEAIYSFVDQVIKIYYDSDEKVKEDLAIQHFVKNVKFGMEDFLSGMKDPEGKKTREELVKYLTAVIFNASAQHAAVNFGQFEWYGCIPNSPSTMRKPPPEEKDSVDQNYIMDTLPDRGCSFEVLGTVWFLTQVQDNEQTKTSSDVKSPSLGGDTTRDWLVDDSGSRPQQRYLGIFPDMHFTEQPVKDAITTFRNKLDELTNTIKRRNEGLTMSYCYLSPDKIPNSVAI
ncbi:Arachidonate 5-lipoxygenase [Triplophysa tibetana]|uniref:Arachidonate 5-lipoxygenase n=1 Tax=Triplophysa tibetana TaxID=1572043 RepID=A0A5A9PF59_9TELE|nr:Arachidonate 5-lipoxygenase [Triplophysa tibetana]